ncbi:MAG: DUF2282 domain-containing protein [Gallionella sp.]|jgi:uncharacterized membrane protein
MKDQHTLISAAITSLLVLGMSASSAYAADNEKCFGVAKAGQNGCNSNANKHSCAGHSKIDNDPNDFMAVPRGSCLKMGGKLDPVASSEKK